MIRRYFLSYELHTGDNLIKGYEVITTHDNSISSLSQCISRLAAAYGIKVSDVRIISYNQI